MSLLFRTTYSLAVAATLIASPGLAESQVRCDMTMIASHVDASRTPIYASQTGERAIYFASDLDVNTDGAARSYHPQDPRGRSLALNNMGNAITRIFDRQGQNITCSPRSGPCYTRFIQTFEAARDAGYPAQGAPRVETTNIIPWKMDSALGRQVPCTISTGPYAGYFVSQTALIVNRGADICDQTRYLDALTMNAIVLPRNATWRSQGVVTDGGDLAVLLDQRSGRVAFALVGDRGPAASLGEGSVALAAALGNVQVAPNATYASIRSLARPLVHTVIFPSRDVPRLTGGTFTQSDIDRLGQDALAAFGGVNRLRACASSR